MADPALCVFTLLLLAGPAFAQQAAPGFPPDGESIFKQHCAKCHGESGKGVSAVLTIAGPPLTAVHDPGAVMTALETGPGHMPVFTWVLSTAEMKAVAAYVTQTIAVIPLTGGDRSEGGELFRVYCAPCHRTAVRGGALAYAGINAPALTGKSAAIIAATIRWGPGPMPSFPPSVLNDRQLASVVDYIGFVQDAPSPGGAALRFIGPVAEGFIGFMAVFTLIGLSMWIEKGGRG